MIQRGLVAVSMPVGVVGLVEVECSVERAAVAAGALVEVVIAAVAAA